jgi:hypothetical protein
MSTTFSPKALKIIEKLGFVKGNDPKFAKLIKQKKLDPNQVYKAKSAGPVAFVAIGKAPALPFGIFGEDGTKTYGNETAFLKDLLGILNNDDWYFGESVKASLLQTVREHIHSSDAEFIRAVQTTLNASKKSTDIVESRLSGMDVIMLGKKIKAKSIEMNIKPKLSKREITDIANVVQSRDRMKYMAADDAIEAELKKYQK